MNEKEKTKKVKLFLDVDDTVLMSSVRAVEIMNERYNLNPPKTYDDIRDWEYRSIVHTMTKEELIDIYACDEFWNGVKQYDEFAKFYSKNKDLYYVTFVTRGTKSNIEKKKEYVNSHFPEAKFVAKLTGTEYHADKSDTNMKNGIQVDDRVDCLAKTNARFKILITHGKNFKWNRVEDCFGLDIYIARNWKEAAELVEFFTDEIMYGFERALDISSEKYSK